MHQECNELEWHSNWCLDSSNFLKIQGQFFSSRRTSFKEVKIGRDRLMKRCLAIDGHDHVLIGRIVVIKSNPSDFR